jgi:hypothetical protein
VIVTVVTGLVMALSATSEGLDQTEGGAAPDVLGLILAGLLVFGLGYGAVVFAGYVGRHFRRGFEGKQPPVQSGPRSLP